MGHLVSKVSRECFITDLLGLEGQLLQSTRQFFGFLLRPYLFLSPLCHSKSLLVLSGSQWRHSLFTINDCCSLADFEVSQEGMPLDTTYSFTVFWAADNEFGLSGDSLSVPYLFYKIESNNYFIYLYFTLFCIIFTCEKPILPLLLTYVFHQSSQSS